MVEFQEPSQEGERRREPRLPTTGRARLNWCSQAGQRSTPVDIRNVNQDGLQVELTEEVELELRQPVHLVGEVYECRGRICYREKRGSVTVVGIEFAWRK
jgi:hypothetical protein